MSGSGNAGMNNNGGGGIGGTPSGHCNHCGPLQDKYADYHHVLTPLSLFNILWYFYPQLAKLCVCVWVKILHILKLKLNQQINRKLRSVPTRIILILPDWHSPIVLCQYKNVPETAEKVANNSAREWGGGKGCIGELGMKDECVLPGRDGGKW